MADHRPWLKLWTKALADPDLSHLSMADRGRWVWLLLFIASNGEGGCVTLASGLRGLRDVLALKNAKDVARTLDRMPGVVYFNAPFPSDSTTVTFTKWAKYQVDSSAERTKRWRQSKRNGDGTSPSQVTVDDRHIRPPGDGVRREEKRREPPYPRDPDTNPEHLRFNIPD